MNLFAVLVTLLLAAPQSEPVEIIFDTDIDADRSFAGQYAG